MKKVKIRFIVVGILLCLIFLAITIARLLLGKESDTLVHNEEDILIREYCWEMVEQYEVKETYENGEVAVTLAAPDYAMLTKKMFQENSEITTEILLNEIQDKSVEIKEYNFTAEDATEEKIKEAFYDQVVYELMIEAIVQTEYIEEWSAEE